MVLKANSFIHANGVHAEPGSKFSSCDTHFTALLVANGHAGPIEQYGHEPSSFTRDLVEEPAPAGMDLSGMNKEALKEQAQSMGIPGVHKMTVEELKAAIMDWEA